jgi:multiple antibiotic resistance protein
MEFNPWAAILNIFHQLNMKAVLSVSMILFAVIDIIGSLPIIIDIRRKTGHIHAEGATLVSFFIMILFLYLGEFILKLIGVDVSSFAIAGSLVIFFLAIEMILGIRLYKEESPSTASVVPIAFPLVAGTGTMTTLISLHAEYRYVNIIVGVVLNLILVYIVLKNVAWIERILGPSILGVLRKVFGVVLLAIAIKLFRTNVGV